MTKYLLLLIVTVISPTAWPLSVNCKNTTTFTEKAICSDSELSKLDNELVYLYQKATANGDTDTIKLEQKYWLEQKRNKCENTTCLKRVYDFRLRELHNILMQSETNKTDPKNEATSKTSKKGLIKKFSEWMNKK